MLAAGMVNVVLAALAFASVPPPAPTVQVLNNCPLLAAGALAARLITAPAA